MNRGKPGLHREIIKMCNTSGSHREGPKTTGTARTTGTAPGTTGTAPPRQSYGNAPLIAVRVPKTGALPQRHRHSPGLRRGITGDDRGKIGSLPACGVTVYRESAGSHRDSTGALPATTGGMPGRCRLSPGHYRRQPGLCRGFTGINRSQFGLTGTLPGFFCGHVVVVTNLYQICRYIHNYCIVLQSLSFCTQPLGSIRINSDTGRNSEKNIVNAFHVTLNLAPCLQRLQRFDYLQGAAMEAHEQSVP
ncbi:hypothetical protein DPMN_006791 [Dreissena polymorpha]|uniref:Uncharacterized protein n=1 Tax=Dreissena polymorpha TaxID=45954 RepID=A0A9D4MUP4_DREPO|nr:hypothetical protein DPMN_006791 [Dreissena polymorpha]